MFVTIVGGLHILEILHFLEAVATRVLSCEASKYDESRCRGLHCTNLIAKWLHFMCWCAAHGVAHTYTLRLLLVSMKSLKFLRRS